MAFTASPQITIPLSILMLIFASFPILMPKEVKDLDLTNEPVFTTTRDMMGEIFVARRMQNAFTHYFLLHAVPAMIWSVTIPMQYWDGLRKSRPALHRFSGYTAASCSLILTISGLAFIPRELSFSKPVLAVHEVYGLPLLPSLNFFLTFCAAPAMLITGSRAVYLARHKRFAEHRRWAVYHGIAGYLISIQRFYAVMGQIIGNVISKSPSLQSFFHTDRIQGLEAISEAEQAVFSFTCWLGGFTSLAWALYVRQRNLAPASKVKTL